MKAHIRLVDTHQRWEHNDIFQITEETELALRRFAYGEYALHCKTNEDHLSRSKHPYIRTVARVNDRASGYDTCALKVRWWFIRILLHTY
jgi:hypothetical protein